MSVVGSNALRKEGWAKVTGEARYLDEVIAEADAGAVSELCAGLQIPRFLAACLFHRGCARPEQAADYLEPRLARLSDPFLLPQMDRAVDRLFVAHEPRECFVIFGDYDVDGVTATALLAEFFLTKSQSSGSAVRWIAGSPA